MSLNIISSSPMNKSLGTDDLSTRVIKPGALEIPQHLLKSFIFARKGTTVPTLTAGGPMLLMYGEETFDMNKQYYNHSTRFLTGAVGAGSTVMAQRVIPTDAGIKSNIVVYLDIVADQIPNYKRTSTGDYVLDTNGDPIANTTTPTISGHKVNIVTEVMTDPMYTFGTAKSKAGNLKGKTSTGTATTSTMYPILEFVAAYQGEAYNNIGFSIDKVLHDNIDDRLLTANQALPYNLSLFERPNPNATPVRMRSLYGEPSVMFTFREKAINPLTQARYDFDAVFDNNWFNEGNPLLPLKYSDFGNRKFYKENYELVLGLVMAEEAKYVSNTPTVWEDGLSAATSTWFDFADTGTTLAKNPEQFYLLDIFNAESSKSINYFSLIVDNNVTPTKGETVTQFSYKTPIFMNGGSDGTLSNEMFEKLVVAEMQKYLDINSTVMDLAINVESVIM